MRTKSKVMKKFAKKHGQALLRRAYVEVVPDYESWIEYAKGGHKTMAAAYKALLARPVAKGGKNVKTK